MRLAQECHNGCKYKVGKYVCTCTDLRKCPRSELKQKKGMIIMNVPNDECYTCYWYQNNLCVLNNMGISCVWEV